MLPSCQCCPPAPIDSVHAASDLSLIAPRESPGDRTRSTWPRDLRVPIMDAHQLWQATLGRLQLALDKPAYDTWVSRAQSISYGTEFAGRRCTFGYTRAGWRTAQPSSGAPPPGGGPLSCSSSSAGTRRQGGRGRARCPGASAVRVSAPPAPVLGGESTRLNPRYSFANFIVGQSNRLAHAGCLAVAENPGLSYNPLFVYGGVGLGKTHLLHAIGNRVVQDGRRTLYVSAETFANELINAIRTRSTEEFRAKYRTIDVLLLDDVQFLIGKERTQEEFFHTFNDLYQDNRQIVLLRPPAKAFCRPRGAAALAVRVGALGGRAVPRPRDAHGDPGRQGGGLRSAAERGHQYIAQRCSRTSAN